MEEDDEDDEDSHHNGSDSDEDSGHGRHEPAHRGSVPMAIPGSMPESSQCSPTFAHIPRTPDQRRASTSLHSDSGISMRSSSPELSSSPWPQRKPARSSHRPPRLEWNLDSSPEAFYTQPSRSNPQTATFKPLQPALPTGQSLVQYSAPPSPPLSAGQQQLIRSPTAIASALSATSRSHTVTRPVYRRFETMTNRLLLQLQAELVAIEQDLAAMDADMSAPPSPTHQHARQRSQRRGDLSPHQREYLAYQRAELFGLLAAKLDQYHRALGAYHVLNGIPKPDAECVEKMKALVQGREGDVDFLSRVEDLAILSSSLSSSSPSGPAPSAAGHAEDAAVGGGKCDVVMGKMEMGDRDRESALFTGGAVLMTILAFKFVPRFIARVVLGGVIVAGMLGCGMLPELQRGRLRRQIGLYAAAVVTLAMIVA
jgi:hypothetical protein